MDFWDWTSDPSGEQAYLTSFLQSVGGSSWLYTVAEYGGGWSGNLLAGTWSDSTPIPASPSDAQIQQEAALAAFHFGAASSANTEIIVATPTGHSTSGFGSQWCAYHGAIYSLPNVLRTTYTNLPYMTDAGTNCGKDSVNGSSGLLDGVSIVEGHELAETITDPLLNGWYDSSGYSSGEIGDKCAWNNLGDVTMAGKTFAIQPLWTNPYGCIRQSPFTTGPGEQNNFVGDSVSVQVNAYAGTPPYTWSAIFLPSGLTINRSTGLITGVIGVVGSKTPTITVTDSLGMAASVTFTWVVTKQCISCCPVC